MDVCAYPTELLDGYAYGIHNTGVETEVGSCGTG
jgi:hypothetical protein